MPINARLLADGSTIAGTKTNPLRTASSGLPSFRAVFDDIALANNKYVAVLFNANTSYKVVVQSVRVVHANLTAVTGVIAEFELRRISAFTTGTAVTPIADDPSADTLPDDISADHNSSSVTDVSGGLIRRFHRTGEEMIIGADTLLLHGSIYEGGSIAYRRQDGMRGLTLSAADTDNSGLAVKCVTNTTEGTVNVEIEFTVEPV
jgi:hypothetical protein